MTDELSLRDGADEHFKVVTAGRTLNCDGNGKAVTGADFKRADGCNRKIKKGETHLLMFAQMQPTRSSARGSAPVAPASSSTKPWSSPGLPRRRGVGISPAPSAAALGCRDAASVTNQFSYRKYIFTLISL